MRDIIIRYVIVKSHIHTQPVSEHSHIKTYLKFVDTQRLDIFIGDHFLSYFTQSDSIVRISSKTIGQTKTIRICIPSYRRISHSHFSEIYQFREIENLGDRKSVV